MADRRPSEFGGVPGRVAPPPHSIDDDTPLAVNEKARLMRATDDTDSGDTPEAALTREWEMEGR